MAHADIDEETFHVKHGPKVQSHGVTAAVSPMEAVDELFLLAWDGTIALESCAKFLFCVVVVS